MNPANQAIDLNQARASLQQQVASGGITQQQMDAELNRLSGLAGNQSAGDPLQAARENLMLQVQSGGITEQQMKDELGRLAYNNAMQGLQPQIDRGDITPEQAEQEANRQRSSAGLLPPNAPGIGANIELGTAMGDIQGQAAANNYAAAQNANLNRLDEQGPYGSATYVRDPETGKVTRNYNLSAPQQELLDQQQQRDLQIGGTVAGSLGQADRVYQQPLSFDGARDVDYYTTKGLNKVQAPRSYSDLPQLPTADGDLGAYRQRLEDRLYSTFERRNQPGFERDEEALRQSLSDRGIPVGSEKYEWELEQLRRSQSDARLDAQTQASVLGGQEMTRDFGIGLDTRNQGIGERNTLYNLGETERANRLGERKDYRTAQIEDRNREIGERMTLRDRPVAEAGALLNLQNGIVNPSFSPIANVGVNPVDVGGTSLGYGSLDNQWNIANLQADLQRELRGGGGGGGGGGAAGDPGPDYFDKKRFETDEKIRYANALAENQPRGPSFSDSLWDLGGSFAGSFAQGFGTGLGKNIF